MSFYPGRADYNNGIISVDTALSSPTVITDRIAEIATPNLLVENIFSQGGTAVQGGAVIYSKTTEKHLHTENDVTARQPGDEYGVVYRETPEAVLARVEDFGGKVSISDEARNRNDVVEFDNEITALTNTVTRKLNRRAMETIEAAEASGEVVQYDSAGNPLRTIRMSGDPAQMTDPRATPGAWFADVMAVAEAKDLGINYNRLIVSPQTKAELRIIYGDRLAPMLDDLGLTLISSNYVNDGAADESKLYLVDQSKAGFIAYEEPLTVTSWRDEAHRQTWVQAYAMPVMGITLPAAVAAITVHAV